MLVNMFDPEREDNDPKAQKQPKTAIEAQSAENL